MRKKRKQGEYEYFSAKRTTEIVKTIVYFAISFSLLFAGWLQTGTKANLLTVVAVLGMLPASKSMVSMIMYLRYHGCSKENYDLLKEPLKAFLHGYGFVFTSYKKTYEAAACIVKNGYIYGYLTNHTDMHQDLEAHIGEIVKQNGMKATVAMYVNAEDFLSRLAQLKDKETENEKKDSELFLLLCEISL